VTKFTSIAVKNLDIDLKYVENFASKSLVRNAKDLMVEPRQLLDLLMSENPQDFLDQGIRRTKFYRLNEAVKVLAILQK
jgi:hypothetical protein